ncbi:Alpha/Beta hydrolase protein [Mycena venus]|uniref:Alpha/Beta hydrolase protein n=1 Tax=Mycena venus TaxID=2733690 RepID=A0A8H7CVR5_9AGAR|nr:Alpha/Beta hydrolase protein [Mycena venus]
MYFELAILVATALAWSASAGTTTTVSNWGDNPSNLPPPPCLYPFQTRHESPDRRWRAIPHQLHPCGGSGSQFMSEVGNLTTYADNLGFPILFPTSNAELGFNCWDCFSTKTLTHNGGGDSEGIAGMVSWALNQFKGDATRVFAVGASSGAMIGNVLAATYPNVFAGIAAWSGVPSSCWANATSSTPSTPDQTCPNGTKARTFSQAQWVNLALSSDPGYSGTRPKMLLTHGTADPLVSILNLNAELAQWSGVLGVSFSKNVTNDPTTNWKRIVYGDGTKLIGFEVEGGGHIPPFQWDATLEFFGLLNSTSNGSGGSSSSGGSSGGGSTGGCSTAQFGQCGGTGFTGCTACASGSTCQFSNPYYSQCL